MENIFLTLEPEKKPKKVFILQREIDKKTEIRVFSNRGKLFNALLSLGTVYKKKQGTEFSQPIAYYMKFYRAIEDKTPAIFYVASTGAFAGKFTVEILNVE